jgi:hypothetical protein
MQDYLDLPEIGDAHAPVLNFQSASDRHLREGQAIVAALPAEAWVSRFFTSFAAAKERLKGPINAYRDVLKRLRAHIGQRGALGLERGQAHGLIVVVQRFLALLPRVTSLSQQVIVQPATLLKLLL